LASCEHFPTDQEVVVSSFLRKEQAQPVSYRWDEQHGHGLQSLPLGCSPGGKAVCSRQGNGLFRWAQHGDKVSDYFLCFK